MCTLFQRVQDILNDLVHVQLFEWWKGTFHATQFHNDRITDRYDKITLAWLFGIDRHVGLLPHGLDNFVGTRFEGSSGFASLNQDKSLLSSSNGVVVLVLFGSSLFGFLGFFHHGFFLLLLVLRLLLLQVLFFGGGTTWFRFRFGCFCHP